MDYEVGDIITYATFGGTERTVEVTLKEDDIKNGRPGFDGKIIGTDMLVWGYDDQIVRLGA